MRLCFRQPGAKPCKISFSYGRTLQNPALEAWHGRDENLAAGQRALYLQASSNGAACVGKYTDEMEAASPALIIRRIAATGATIDAHDRGGAVQQLDDTGSGGNDGKRAV